MSTLSQFFGGGGSSPFFANTAKSGIAVGDMIAAPLGSLTTPNWLPLRQANGDRTSYLQASYSELIAVLPTVYRYVPGGFGSVSAAFTPGANASTAFGAGLFVAAPTSGNNVSSSPDGITWTARGGTSLTFSSGGGAVNPAITFTNGQFIFTDAGSNSLVFYSSSDGITWTARTAPSSNPWTEIAFGAGAWVSVSNGSGTLAMSSTAIATWTARTLPTSQQWRGVAFGAGLFVAMSGGTSTYATSPDGVTWTSRTLPYASRDGLYNMAFNGSVFVVQVASQPTTSGVLVSSDGLNWTFAATPFAATTAIRAANGLFFISQGTTGQFAISADGVSWNIVQTSLTLTNVDAASVSFGAGMYLSVDKVGTVLPRWTMDNATSFQTPRVQDGGAVSSVVTHIRAKP